MEVNLKHIQVLLKKTKITKSILQQASWISYENLNGFKILGWCNDGDNRVVVSYNETTTTICKSDYYHRCNISEITKENAKNLLDIEDYHFIDEIIGEYMLLTSYDGCKEIIKHRFETKKDAEDYKEILSRYMKKVNEQGQFYL